MEEQKIKAPSGGQKSHGFAIRKQIVVRFLVLVTTMVTKVDHSNYRSNNRSNHRGYYDGYYNGNTFFSKNISF